MIYVAEALSRNQLRAVAAQIRKIAGFENEFYFPIVEFLEFAMPMLFSDFYYEIVTKDAFPTKKHAETDVQRKCIRIREDVYDRAVKGYGRDRMTIAHEIAHYILLIVCGVKFSRSFDSTGTAAYCDPEWQAKALAGEIMCAAHLIKGRTAEAVAKYCGVSRQAAEYNLKKAEECT